MNMDSAKKLLDQVISSIAYERGHSAGDKEVSMIESEMKADFGELYARLTEMDAAIENLADHVRDGECNPALADEAMLLLGDTRLVSTANLSGDALHYATCVAAGVTVVKPDNEYCVVVDGNLSPLSGALPGAIDLISDHELSTSLTKPDKDEVWVAYSNNGAATIDADHDTAVYRCFVIQQRQGLPR